MPMGFRVSQFTVCSFMDGCTELCEMQADEKCPSKYFLICLVIAVSHLLDMNVVCRLCAHSMPVYV